MKTAKIDRVRQRIAQHREGRAARSPLPDELWAEATAIAAEIGAYAAGKQLGVSYESLRTRLDERAASVERDPRPAFVELPGTASWPPLTSGDVVEVEDPSGAKLTLRLGSGAVDVAAVVRAFRQERP